MKRLWMMGLALWLVGIAARAANEPWLVYAATKIGQAPVIDGRLSDPCWQGIEQTRPFIRIGGAPAATETRAMVCWDKQNLYIAFDCAEPAMADIRKRMADGTLRPYQESVEIFLDPDLDRFMCMHLRVDILGNRDSRPDGELLDRDMDRLWSGIVAVESNRWTVEVAIPLRMIAPTPPQADTLWGLNLNLSSTRACTCWSDTKGGFYAPDRFGNLVFFPYPMFLRSYFSASFRSDYDEIERLNRRSRTTAARSGTQVAKIRKENEQYIKSLESAAMARGADAAAPYARGLEQQRKLAVLQEDIRLQVIGDPATAFGK